jgi:large subunit ribosomal protein L13
VKVVDGSRMVMGRLASIVAKELLGGNRVVVVNVEKVVVTGTSKRSVMDRFVKRLNLRSNVNPRRHGPFSPRSPEGIFRKVVRGMLPRRKAKGREAYKRLRVFRGVPKSVDADRLVVYEEARYKENSYPYMYLEEISRLVGWSPVEERLSGVVKGG